MLIFLGRQAIFTVRNEVTKVMFLYLSVCPRGWGGGRGVCLSACWDTTPQEQAPQEQTPTEQTPPRADTPPEQTPPQSRHLREQALPGADTPPREQTHPPGADGYCCRWYASHWNAFLCHLFLLSAKEVCEGYVFTGVCLSTGVGSLSRGVCPEGSLSRGGLCPRGSLSREFYVQGGGGYVQGISVQGGLCPGGSLSKGGLCPGRLCLGVSV